MSTPMSKALQGIRIVDLTSGVAGTSATKLLGALGAEVIKVENPEGGDLTRNLVPYIFEAFNGGKRSITVDLKTPEGAEVVRKLVATADVFVQSMRPGAVNEAGLGRAELTALNPRLIYASFSAFGSSGPSSHRRGVDAVIQAESGLVPVQGRVIDNLSFIDASSGLALSQAILAALMNRERTGEVDHVGVTLLDTAIYLQSGSIAEYSVTGNVFTQEAFDAQYGTVGIFEAADGPLYIAAYWDRDWRNVCTVIERPDMETDERFATLASRGQNIDVLRAELNAELQRRPRVEWVRALESHGVLAGETKNYADVLVDEQVVQNLTLETVTLASGAEARIPRPPFQFVGHTEAACGPAPLLGADTESVLDELGLTDAVPVNG